MFLMPCKIFSFLSTENYKHSMRFCNLKLVKNKSKVQDKLDALKQLNDKKKYRTVFLMGA